MGAWIEIFKSLIVPSLLASSHPTMGAWIEIYNRLYLFNIKLGRTPRWVRGLKFFSFVESDISKLSHPTMGAWIEIIDNTDSYIASRVAPHDGCVD